MSGNQLRIAISGKARTGKNTVADLIIKHLNLKESEYRIRAFADPMKQIIEVMFPNASKECLYGASELRSNVIEDFYRSDDGKLLTYRTALTDIGKKARQYNQNIWVYNFHKDLLAHTHVHAYVASDLRFINEFNYLKEQDFYLIRVLRDGTSVGTDVSETEQEQISDDKFDRVIHNDFSIETLSWEVLQTIYDARIKQNIV